MLIGQLDKWEVHIPTGIFYQIVKSAYDIFALTILGQSRHQYFQSNQ